MTENSVTPGAVDLVDRLVVGSYTAATGGRGAGVALLARDPATGRVGHVLATDPCDSPSFLVGSTDVGTLHAAHELDEGRITTRRFDGTSWETLGTVASGGSSPCQIAVQPGGELLVVANYGGGVGVIAAPGGVVTDLVQTIEAAGSGPDAERQEASHPHSATFLDERHVAICDLGTDEVRVHVVEDGRLSVDPVQVVTLAPGTGPRHAVVRDGGFFLAGELDAGVTSLSLARGRLADPVRNPALVGPVDVTVYPSEITLAPWGLVVANRRAEVVTLHEVVDGVARPVRDLEFGGVNPRHVAVLGRDLYVSAQDSDLVVHLRIDDDLRIVDRSVVAVGSPAFVLPF